MKKGILFGLLAIVGIAVGIFVAKKFLTTEDSTNSANKEEQSSTQSPGHEHDKAAQLKSQNEADMNMQDSGAIEWPDQKSPFTGLPHANEIENFLQAANTVGPQAKENERKALEKLKAAGPQALQSVYKGYKNMPEELYHPRRLAIATMAELRNPEALPYFAEVINAPIPPEKMEDTHHFSSVEAETLIKVSALRGVENIATTNNQAAEAILFETATSSSNISVIRAAIVGYLNAGPDTEARAEKLKTNIDPQFHSLIVTQNTDVKAVDPQEPVGETHDPELEAQKGDPVPQDQGDQ